MVAHTCDSHAWEVETGESPKVEGQSEPHSELKDSLKCTARRLSPKTKFYLLLHSSFYLKINHAVNYKEISTLQKKL